ncbi:anti-sigma F factor [Pontibacillus yanchengensis]|uniref:Anti-sigma F factor n=2 Tax=Pontibacillus yanchengensis TaxID=462910 RepID=A0ACC7VKB3_9BACI|nr:anti-sigma F factor [Pontibacillus yanchengensis]MYL32671.1 anti-sigma F factor [Pontibacillus yanchengensis]MYL55065.1 anti-sigma F factor [Pontibacillus yanchengensis]
MNKNEMHIQFSAVSENESFARVTVAAFVTQLDPTMDELTEMKTVVSEAVTNSIIHGYDDHDEGLVHIDCVLCEGSVELTIWDEGMGIDNIDEAKQPLYTSKPELERSGMGFTIMENFMDEVDITSIQGQGTTVRLVKHLKKSKTLCN